MELQAGETPRSLIDGFGSWNASAEDALAIWNSHMSLVRFTWVRNRRRRSAPERKEQRVLVLDGFWTTVRTGVLAVTKRGRMQTLRSGPKLTSYSTR